MKTTWNRLFNASLLGVTLLFTACGKQETTTQDASTDADAQSLEAANAEAEKQAGQIAGAANTAAADVKAKTDAAVAEVKTQTATTIDSANAAANNAATTANTEVQGFIDQAKAFIAEKKYAEALNSLSQAANLKLTPEQQDVITKLKAQIQSALATQGQNEGLKAVGGLLEKK
jgi:hypothetical protein